MKKVALPFLRLNLFFVMLLMSLNGISQTITYVHTKTITNGVEKEANYQSKNYEFSGDMIYEKFQTLNYNHTISKYKFHHRSDGNSIYYVVGYDIVSGRDIILDHQIMIVSPDKSIMNLVSYNRQGQVEYTWVYERKVEAVRNEGIRR